MKTLLIVDLQNDFMPGGALPVPDGDAVIPVANRLLQRFELVLATQDWHPADHASFATNHPERDPGEVIDLDGIEQVLWPAHCVRDTPGAAFVDALDTGRIDRVFRKGTDARIDSYSGFFDNGHRKSTGLGDFLADRGVREVHILGVATDYCVKFSALDARELGFETCVVEDGCRGVNLQPGDADRALAEMVQAGVGVVHSREL